MSVLMANAWLVCSAFVGGAAVALAALRFGAAARRAPAPTAEQPPAEEQARVQTTMHQLRDMAHAMAGYVAAHRAFVAKVSRQLSDDEAPSCRTMKTAVEGTLEANGRLRRQMVVAQQQLQVHADELQTLHRGSRRRPGDSA
jgi:hypothetical protein